MLFVVFVLFSFYFLLFYKSVLLSHGFFLNLRDTKALYLLSAYPFLLKIHRVLVRAFYFVYDTFLTLLAFPFVSLFGCIPLPNKFALQNDTDPRSVLHRETCFLESQNKDSINHI